MWTLLDDLDALYLEHRRCGRLDTGVEGGHIWLACDCRAMPVRLIGREEEARDAALD